MRMKTTNRAKTDDTDATIGTTIFFLLLVSE